MPKKKTALTIEERLQQALVPAEEQPYEVPENWVWVRLGEVVDVLNGDRGKNYPAKSTLSKEGIPFISAANLCDNIVVEDDLLCMSEEQYSKLSAGKLMLNDIVLCIRGSLGKHGKFPFKKGAIASSLVILRSKDRGRLTDGYVMQYLDVPLFYDEIKKYDNGTAQPNLAAKNLELFSFPLPPLSEQQRIVERIEELFAKLDEAKERLQEVADSFAVRKAAILHKAFTGELIGKQVTELVPLENLVDLIKIGPFGSSLHESDYIENGIPLVNPKHIVQQRIVPQSKISISDEKAEELSSYKLKENDIVLGRRGEMGRCAPISNREENWICGTGSMIIRLKKEYDAKLYSLILGSQATVTYLENSAVGSTLKNLNEKIVRKIPVPQFSNEEQHEIVRLIDDLLARERAAQQATEQALASIDLMKKSILARAFRGELGTNKASEASALELLRQVLAEN